MKRFWMVGILAFGIGIGLGNAWTTAAEKGNRQMIAHNVYFALKDKSPEAVEKLVALCNEYLTNHSGTVFYAAGTLAKEFDRPVNDREFDVALHIVFADKAAHDKYQDDERHLKFIEAGKANWDKVRVFDSVVEIPTDKS